MVDVGQRDPLLSVGGLDGEEQGDPDDGTLSVGKNLPKQGPDLERENESHY